LYIEILLIRLDLSEKNSERQIVLQACESKMENEKRSQLIIRIAAGIILMILLVILGNRIVGM